LLGCGEGLLVSALPGIAGRVVCEESARSHKVPAVRDAHNAALQLGTWVSLGKLLLGGEMVLMDTMADPRNTRDHDE
jgi:hypothetical protein